MILFELEFDFSVFRIRERERDEDFRESRGSERVLGRAKRCTYFCSLFLKWIHNMFYYFNFYPFDFCIKFVVLLLLLFLLFT